MKQLWIRFKEWFVKEFPWDDECWDCKRGSCKGCVILNR